MRSLPGPVESRCWAAQRPPGETSIYGLVLDTKEHIIDFIFVTRPTRLQLVLITWNYILSQQSLLASKMLKRTCNLLIIGLLLISRASGSIKIDRNADSSFAIEFKGVKVLEHWGARPLLSVGMGSFDAIENQGNFVITDDVKIKVGLDMANFIQSNQQPQ